MAREPGGRAELRRILASKKEAAVDSSQTLFTNQREHGLFQREGAALGGFVEAFLGGFGHRESGEHLSTELAHLPLLEGVDSEDRQSFQLFGQSHTRSADQQQLEGLSKLRQRYQLAQELEVLLTTLLQIVDHQVEGLFEPGQQTAQTLETSLLVRLR